MASKATEIRWEEFLAKEQSVRDELFHRSAGATELVNLQLRAAARARAISQVKVVAWLRKAAGTFGDALAPMAACRSGCSACCHIPVMVLASEAKVIGREIGRVPHAVPMERRNQDPPEWRGSGHACHFLKNDRCSIYASRPIACRLLFNLDRDALLCQHQDTPTIVPYADTRQFQLEAASLAVQDDYIAELGEFFT
jgi:Fe-S-cluster containining protein